MINGYSLFDYIGKIGVFGDLQFTIMDKFMLSPQNGVSIDKAAEYETHTPIQGLDCLEFKKRSLVQVSMKIKLININISDIKNKLDRMCSTGEHYPLLLGYDSSSTVSSEFVLKNYKEVKTHTDSRGNALACELEMNFLEYNPQIERGEVYSENLSQNSTEEKTESEIANNNDSVYKELNWGPLW